MSRILVTGADGFIGSHLVEELVRQGRSVRAFVLYNSFDHWGWLDSAPAEIKDAIEVVAGDIRDRNSVDAALAGCSSVLHLAALIGIPYSYRAAESYVDVNVHGTLNVVEAARRHNLEKVVITSTSEVYGTAQFVPITETIRWSAQSPYAATKIAADQLALSFQKSFGVPVAVARPFNTYGPRQSARAVIPTIISQIANGAAQDQARRAAPDARLHLRHRHRARPDRRPRQRKVGRRSHQSRHRHSRSAIGEPRQTDRWNHGCQSRLCDRSPNDCGPPQAKSSGCALPLARRNGCSIGSRKCRGLTACVRVWR